MTIYLYVKTHNKTGLKYLGKTKSKDPYIYQGSGTYWMRHIKQHGYDVETVILRECVTNKEVKEWGLYYSNLWNVVESNEWANIKPEEGDGGDTSKTPKYIESLKNKDISGVKNPMYGKSALDFMTEEAIAEMKRKQSAAGKGRKQSPEHVRKRIESRRNSGAYSRPRGTSWNKGKKGVCSVETRMKKSKPVVFRGVEYWSAGEAARVHGTTAYYIMKEINGIVTSSTRKCTTRKRTTSK